jgi:hypothetical protein
MVGIIRTSAAIIEIVASKNTSKSEVSFVK